MSKMFRLPPNGPLTKGEPDAETANQKAGIAVFLRLDEVGGWNFGRRILFTVPRT